MESSYRIYARLVRGNGWRITLTYALLAIELALELSRPWLWGLAINALLIANINGLYLAAGQHVLAVTFGTIRRRFDTRTFARIYARLAADVVLDQHARSADISYIAARARLSRELVDFLERDLYALVQGAFYLIGAVTVIHSMDASVSLACVSLMLPVTLLNMRYAKLTLHLNRGLNDRIEKEVASLVKANAARVQRHFLALTRWRVRLSDADANNFLATEIFILALILFALWRFTGTPAADAGGIFASMSYVGMFLAALDNIPRLIEQTSKIRDVVRRLG